MARSRIPHEVDVADIMDNVSEMGVPEVATFAKTFNQLLVDRKIHQDDLAQALGISTGSISSYRNGKKEPRLSMIIKIADYFGVDCHYLMTGVNAENATTAKETGLSDAAIQKLAHIKNNHPEYSAVFSIFVENFNFEYFLHLLLNRFLYSASEYNVRAVIKTEDGVDHLKNAKEFHDSINKREVHIQFDNLHFISDKRTLLDSIITNTLISDIKEMAKTYLERKGKKGGK